MACEICEIRIAYYDIMYMLIVVRHQWIVLLLYIQSMPG